jgi:hypothetical protein
LTGWVRIAALSGWAVIGLVVAGLILTALFVLLSDIARGDVGGGRHTMARARRLLVVATDDRTGAEADRWVEAQRRERPELQCFVLVERDSEGLFQDVQGVIEREHPDAIVMVRNEADRHNETGTYARLREQLSIPIDAVYVPWAQA